ncbi:unnamed protein product [Symbiodinium natans]|uniref:Amino acid transporter transmembrane domain-containing protein n=1 Tax=Symbiodinium natans TaxID=878477 RepID=A0A812LMS1_9DINO|nr:unnamed protein product [Symbiodinium natans]
MNPLQLEDPPRHRSWPQDRESSVRLRSSLVVQGRSSSVALHDAASRMSACVYLEKPGLTVMQAAMVAFNSAVGSTVAILGSFPSQCGWQAFGVIMLTVAITGALQQSALISTSCQLGAVTFDELCQPLPAWSSRITVASFLVYFWGCMGFYCQFVEVFLADQVCPALCGSGSDWLCNSEYRIGLLVSIFFALVSWPPQLAGTAAVCINYTNFAVKWVVIITAVAKGVHTAFFVEAERTYTAWAPAGMVRIACMLMGSYANTGIMPQLAADIDKSQQERAAKLCPSIAVGLQFFVYLALAYSAYFGLGNAIGTDVFASYNELYPDFMTSILQGGLALLVWLSSPLVILPMKAQIYGLLSRGEADLSKAPPSLQVGLTFILALSGAMAPCIVGTEAFTKFLFFLACTCGNWFNFFLPAMVVLYCQVWSPKHTGDKNLPRVLCVWLFFLGGLGLIDAGFQILESLSPKDSSAKLPLPTRCAAWRHAAYPDGNAMVV